MRLRSGVERVRAGLRNARAKGRNIGRPKFKS
jgi:DNA invertase Pin-like site-specific DNA recombinase